jgi:hypothetical protein
MVSTILRSCRQIHTREGVFPQLPGKVEAVPTLRMRTKVIGRGEQNDEQGEVERDDEESLNVVLRCRHGRNLK